jgi:hypothetical protein
MPNRFSPQELLALPAVLSQPRYATYARQCGNNPLAALTLYHWNAQISAAFLFPLHILEICVRNAAANAIESRYNDRWPWARAFENSLPDPPWPDFSPRRELRRATRKHSTTGKVISDLKFAFWVSLYTSRHEGRLWNSYALREFPNFPPGTQPQLARQSIHDVADNLRELRNRIAHHEPVFRRDLVKDYADIHEVVSR